MDALSRLIDVADKNWSDLGFFLYGFWLDRGWSSTCNAFEFFGILNGSVDIMLDNERVTLYPGDIVFLDNNSICSCDGGSFALYHIVFFGSTDVINRELSVIFKSLAGTVMRTGDISLMNYFAFFNKERAFRRPFADMAARESFLHILIGVARIRAVEAFDAFGVINDDLCRALSDYLQTKYPENIDLATMGRVFGYNGKYLNSVFKKNTGITLRNYLTQIRIEAAKRMLSMTSARVSEIAIESGFYDAPHFCKTFKVATGMTPNAFKELGKNRYSSC